MSDLAASCALSLSGMTRIVSRLEGQGLVRRDPCPSDGRGYNAVLTDAGLTRLRGAWPTHLASVRRHMMDHLNALDLPAVTAALQRFASGPADAETGHAPGRPGDRPGRPARSGG
jgi:DNA-binding MarR family transcriptional regulator